jgi:glycosyltransferase involved in cell wall biosynthesis
VSTAPLVSIGLPVYNGESFLAQALDSLLGQTLTDLELLISDNASTDRTADICREYAARDARIRYMRQEVNVGPRRNWNFVAEQARGRYFKWATANDFCDRRMLERCIEAMNADASVVLCHGRTCMVDERTGAKTLYPRDISAMHARPSERFKSVVRAHALNNALNGVARLDVLRRTPLIRPYLGGDVVLTAELALHGRIVLLPEVLFFRRIGPQTSSMQLKPTELQKFYYPPASGAKPGREQWRRHIDYLQTILRTPSDPAEKLRAVLAAARNAACDRLLLLDLLPAPARQAARHLIEASPYTSKKRSGKATNSG